MQLQYGGVTTINITGGDPLCHPDIFKMIHILSTYNILFNISTKRILKSHEIQALSEAGLKTLQISIDSSDDIVNERLIHRKNYYKRQKKVIRELIRCGIDVEVNSVVNALNIQTIIKLLVELNDLGVKKMTLTPYLSVNQALDTLLMTSESQIMQLYDELEQYQNLPIRWVLSVPEQDIEYSYHDGQHNICSGGRLSLVINHDGCVTICERLVDNPSFCVGNIQDSKLVEIWNGDKMLNLTHPSVQSFRGTQCFSCKEFDKCITEKGTCYARISKTSSHIFDCDPFCEKALRKVRFH